MTEAQNRRAVDAARWIVFLPFSMGTYVLLALCGMAIIDSYRLNQSSSATVGLVFSAAAQIIGVAIAPRLRLLALFIQWIAFDVITYQISSSESASLWQNTVEVLKLHWPANLAAVVAAIYFDYRQTHHRRIEKG